MVHFIAHMKNERILLLDFEMAKKIIDYLYNIWSVHLGITSPRKIIFGFYGGEPLLNMPLIK